MNINTASQSELDARAAEDEHRRGAVALGKVHDFLGRFVVYPSKHAQVAHALWVLHAHLMDRWDTTPRLAFLSAEPASGKSRALEITELLVPCPVTAVNVSPAYLFRKVGCEEGATILYDEIDTVFGPKAKDNEGDQGPVECGPSPRCGRRQMRRAWQDSDDRGNTGLLSGCPCWSRLAT
jgi:hypothetical protein